MKKGSKKTTKENIADKIKSAKEKLKGREGAALRAARKKVKRLQRTKRKINRSIAKAAPKPAAEAKA